MARPVSVSDLLGGLKGKNGRTGAVGKVPRKAKFLSKSERAVGPTRMVASVKASSESVKRPPVELDGAVEADNGEVALLKAPGATRGSKFAFEWQDSDDTLAGYKPITSISAKELLKQSNGKNSALGQLEGSHIGKHWSQKSFNEMSQRDWRIFNEDFQLTIRGDNTKHPLRNWDERELIPSDLLHVITDKLHMPNPTPIQRATIPNAVGNRSILGIAATGSGKTLSFIIPVLANMSGKPDRPRAIKVMEGPKVLILAPTRELAQQIKVEADKVTSNWTGRDVSVVSVVGGHSMSEISQQLTNGCDILVATPGRLIDCLENHVTTISAVSTVILDEADKMIDLGFEEQLTTILARLNTEGSLQSSTIQTMMFSATMTPKIESITRTYLNNPVNIRVGGTEDSAPKIKQVVTYAQDDDKKFAKVVDYLRGFRPPIIIFINHKRIADMLADKFHSETTYKVVTLHGSKNQEQREKALDALRSNRAQIMIATNVAARGLDIPDVSLVINYEMTKNFEDYVHRIGRTGRAGKVGTALTLVGDYEDSETIKKLAKYVKTEDPLDSNEFDSYVKKKYETERNQFDNIIY